MKNNVTAHLSSQHQTGQASQMRFTPLLLTGAAVIMLCACQPVSFPPSNNAQPVTSEITQTQPDQQPKAVSNTALIAEAAPSENIVLQNEAIAETETQVPEILLAEDKQDKLALKSDERETQTVIIEKKQKPAAAQFKPVNQLGKKQSQLKILIGSPDKQRMEGKIMTWQYQQPDCIVDFFFSVDGHYHGNEAVVSWDMRAKEFGAALDQQRCEAQLADRKTHNRS